jgi:hypothetical protein
MKTNSINLVGAVALGLLASTAFAGESPEYTASTTWQVDPVVKGQIKLACAEGTAFKNEFPSLTNGNGPGTASNTYTIPGYAPGDGPAEVAVDISWFDDNSFDFTVSPPGALSRLIVSSGQTLDYDYLGVLGEAKASDTGVHRVEGGAEGPDISHLDFCLVAAPPPPPPPPVDTDAPVITDVIIEAVPGEGTVSISDDGVFTVVGLVDIKATVTDDSGFSVILELNGEDLGAAMAPAGSSDYTYRWTTSTVPSGNYILQIIATDEFGNHETVTLEVTVLTPFEACLEGEDKIPLGEDGEGGCSIPGVTLEYPNELSSLFPEITVTQTLIKAIPNEDGGNQTTACGLDMNLNVVSEVVTQDSRVDQNGKILVFRELQLAELFDIQGHFEEFHPDKLAELGGVAPRPKLGVTDYFVTCGVLYHQHGPDFDEFEKPAAFYFSEDRGGPTSVLTQDPVDVPEVFANAPRLTAPLNFCDLDLDNCEPVPACFASEDVQCYQPFQGWVEQAYNQPDDNNFLVGPPMEQSMFNGTTEAYNAARTRGFKGTFAALNVRDVCVDLEGDASMLQPYSAAYLQAEYECKIDQARELFFDLETAIKESARNLPAPDDVNAILNPHSKALSQIKVERFNRALRDLDDLLDEIATAPWFPIDEFNDPGRLVMYTDALIFRVEQLEETQGCLQSPACIADLESLNQP